MKILAHRGYWGDEIERNSKEAIFAAMDRGYGFESDVRDYCGKLVISHDLADKNSWDAEEIFRDLRKHNDSLTFAVNIKSDGLKALIKSLIMQYEISNYFLFDMSIPQMIEFDEMGLRFYTRQSEVEPEPCMYQKAQGVWVDGFWSMDWVDKRLIENHLNNGKDVVIVSPELHGDMGFKQFWDRLRSYELEGLSICTDRPDEAREFFNE